MSMTREELWDDAIGAVRDMVERELTAPKEHRNPRQDQRISEEVQEALQKVIAAEVRHVLTSLATPEAPRV